MSQNNNSKFSKSEKSAENVAWDPMEAMKELDQDIQDIEQEREETGEFIETLEGDEETVESKKINESSEQKGEDKAAVWKSSQQAASQAQKAQQLKAQLLRNAPAPAIMKKQIENKIYKEIKKINKRIRKIGGRTDMAYELNVLVAKARELKELLSKLVHATFETLKSLWLKIVHGLA